MRLLWYWPHPHRGASPYALGSLSAGDTLTVQALSSYRGEEFDCIAEYTVVRNLPDPTRPGPRLVRPARRMHDMVSRVRRRRALIALGFDCVHIETITYAIDAFDLPRLARKLPVVAVVHDVDPHVARLPTPIEGWLRRRVYRSGATLVVFHDVLAELLVAKYRVPSEMVHVVPMPLVDGTVEDAPATSSPAVRHVLFFGALRANKGLPTLVEAIQAVATADIRVTIAGAGEPSLERLVRRVAATDPRVYGEIGYVSHQRKQELFASADLIVLPYSAFASQSAVLGDAYRARVPVVVTDVGAIGPTVRRDRTGEVVPPLDPMALAAAIDRVLAAPRHSWRPALDDAMARHEPSVAGQALGEIYRTAAAMWSCN